MVVSDLQDHDRGDFRQVRAAVWADGWGVVCQLEDQAVGPSKVKRPLSGTITREDMEAPWRGQHLAEVVCNMEDGKSPLEDGPLLGAEPSEALALGRTVLCELVVGPRDVNRCAP